MPGLFTIQKVGLVEEDVVVHEHVVRRLTDEHCQVLRVSYGLQHLEVIDRDMKKLPGIRTVLQLWEQYVFSNLINSSNVGHTKPAPPGA